MLSAVQLEKKQKNQKQNRADADSAFFVGGVAAQDYDFSRGQIIYYSDKHGYMIFKIKKTHLLSKAPAYAMPGDAGMDLFSIEHKIIKPMALEQIHTGIEVELPADTVGLVWDKGGISTNHSVKVMGGVFDENYRGELIISLMNLSDKPYCIEPEDKIAQLLIQKIEHPQIQETDKLSPSQRGSNRLGSTGK